MRVCSKCGQEKPLSEFHKDKTSKDGYRRECKGCRKKKAVLQSSERSFENVVVSGDKDCNTVVMGNDFTDEDVLLMREMLDWFKQKKNFCNTEVINVLQIDLPESEFCVRSMRVNNKVWDRWQRFCKKHFQFRTQDLVSQAFLDFMKFYNE